MLQVTVTDTPPQATDLAAERLAETIAAGRSEGRPVHLSVAGGNTPRATYRRLAGLVDDWEGVELWLGDERMVPLDDPESNYRQLAETLLEATGALAHPVATEGSAEEAASAYAREIRRRVSAGPDGVPTLDLALLGIGEDGHTAEDRAGDSAGDFTAREGQPKGGEEHSEAGELTEASAVRQG